MAMSKVDMNPAPSVEDDLASALSASVARFSGRDAVTELQVSRPWTVTYRELWFLVESASEVLRYHEDCGSAVIIFMQRSILSIVMALAAIVTNQRFVFLNPRLRLPQIRSILAAARSNSLFLDGPSLVALRPNSLPPDLFNGLDFILLHTGPLPKGHGRAASTTAEICTTFHPHDLFATRRSAKPTKSSGVITNPGCCLFTSGSTGTSKGVLISGDDLLSRASAEVEAFGMSDADKILNVLPFSFDVGLNQMLSSLICGAELVITPSWLPADLFSTIARRGITGVSGVPTIWNDFLNAGVTLGAGSGGDRLRYVTVSGGSLSPERFRALQKAVAGAGVIKTYGQTETFRSAALLPGHPEEKSCSVGAPFGDAQIMVIRDDLTPCGPGEVGEILHSGLGVMEGYLSGNADSKLIDNPYADGVEARSRGVLTGDYGWLDADGFLFLKGRKDSMVKIHGNRVYPEEVSECIQAIDEVQEAEVIAVPGAGRMNEPALVAFVVLRNSGVCDDTQVRGLLRDLLPTFMMPAEIRFVDGLPRMVNGKVDKVRLREIFDSRELT